jgi:hypothetical protein
MSANPFVGTWSYRSFLNDPDFHVTKDGDANFNKVRFGYGTLTITETGPEMLGGTIGTAGQWMLRLQGSMSPGNPGQARFQGRGVVGGAEWIYDYVGWLVPAWPNGVQQRRAIVGSVVRTIPHPGSDGGVSPAGVVSSFYAVLRD